MHSKMMIQNCLRILSVLDVSASLRCTQFLLIQGFWSCFVLQSCGHCMEDIIGVTPLCTPPCFVWMCVFVHVFKYLHCPWQRQNCGSWVSIILLHWLFFQALLCPEGSRRSPSSSEEGKKKILNARCLTTGNLTWKRCHYSPAPPNDCLEWSRHLWCGSPKEQKDIRETAIHDACFDSAGQSFWDVSASRMWGKLSGGCQSFNFCW